MTTYPTIAHVVLLPHPPAPARIDAAENHLLRDHKDDHRTRRFVIRTLDCELHHTQMFSPITTSDAPVVVRPPNRAKGDYDDQS